MAQQPLSNVQLKELASDPRFTDADRALLLPEEQTRLQQIQSASTGGGRLKGMASGATDVLTGIGKGAAERAFNAGGVIHNTPLLGQLTDKLSQLVGPEAYRIGQGKIDVGQTNPEAAFAQPPKELDAENGYQAFGKGAEQLGEFFVPAGPARLAAVKGLLKLVPASAGPRAVALANKLLPRVARVLGEAGSAAGVSALQGDETPERPAAIAGGTTVGVEALASTAKALLTTKLGREIAPFLAGISALGLLGGTGMVAGGAALGAYGLTQKLARYAIKSGTKAGPKAFTAGGAAPEMLYGAGSKLGRVAAGAESASRRPQRRRLQEAP